MPRDPKDISVDAAERGARRLGELDDQKDPIRLRVGAGPAGSEGPEGKEGPKGATGEKGASFRGHEALVITSEVGAAPTELVNRLTYAATATMKKLGAGKTDQVITLHQTAAKVLTVKDGENLKLAGEFALGENDTLTLLYDGTNWVEIGRANT